MKCRPPHRILDESIAASASMSLLQICCCVVAKDNTNAEAMTLTRKLLQHTKLVLRMPHSGMASSQASVDIVVMTHQ
jgi:hypothetical protein